jgi:hypothetical protein
VIHVSVNDWVKRGKLFNYFTSDRTGNILLCIRDKRETKPNEKTKYGAAKFHV